MQILIVSCSIISVIMSIIAIGLGLFAVINVEAFKRSTHKIEWMPVKDPFENKVEDLEDFADDGINDLN